MTTELIKKMMDACYQAKRIREMLPPLPKGVMPSYIHYLDVIQQLEQKGLQVKVSDISEALSLPRPGVTRTVKDMEKKGYLRKIASKEDGRVTYLSATETGAQLLARYDRQYFSMLMPFLQEIPEEDLRTTIRTIQDFYKIMCERRISLDK